MNKLVTTLAYVSLLLIITGCTVVVPNGDTTASPVDATASTQTKTVTAAKTPVASSTYKWGVRTKTSGCRASNGVQDHACTPGDILPEATKEKVCVPGYSKSVRNVPESEKNDVYASYDIASHTAGEYEVDHLVSLELGGSNDISNLWPELASPKPGFHDKDKVENWLHDQVCKGAMSLQDAQIMIATDWHQALNMMQ